MPSIRALLAVAVVSSLAAAQTELWIPDNLPNAGTCNAYPFGTATCTLVERIPASLLDPANRAVTGVAYAPCNSGTFSTASAIVGIGHLSSTAAQPFTFPTFDAAGNLTSTGMFLDFTFMWRTPTDGPLVYPYTANVWSPFPTSPSYAPFVWNGVDQVGIFLMHQGSTGTSTFHRTATEPARWYALAWNPTVSSGSGANGPKTRLTVAPAVTGPTATTVGTGCPSANSIVPAMTTLQLPALGNFGFSVDVASVPANTALLLYASIGIAPSPTPVGAGCVVYLDIPTLTILVNAAIFPIGPVLSGPTGTAGFGLPIPNDPGLAGTHVGLQTVVFDAAAPLTVTLTNALELVLH